MHKYKELIVWQKAVDTAVAAYKMTQGFPAEERFGLTTQIRRSAVSIASNIAEGAGRNSSNEFNHFLGISNGSSCELDTQLVIAQRLDFIKEENYLLFGKQLYDIQGMIVGLQQSLFKK